MTAVRSALSFCRWNRSAAANGTCGTAERRKVDLCGVADLRTQLGLDLRPAGGDQGRHVTAPAARDARVVAHGDAVGLRRQVPTAASHAAAAHASNAHARGAGERAQDRAGRLSVAAPAGQLALRPLVLGLRVEAPGLPRSVHADGLLIDLTEHRGLAEDLRRRAERRVDVVGSDRGALLAERNARAPGLLLHLAVARALLASASCCASIALFSAI